MTGVVVVGLARPNAEAPKADALLKAEVPNAGFGTPNPLD